MAKVVGYYLNNLHIHQKTCPKCHAIIEFDNNEIIKDDMGMCIVCPNCNHDIKF